MTPEDQRIAIAEALGRKYHKPTDEELVLGSYYQYEPDYLKDLNLMHEAMKIFTPEQEWRFGRALSVIIFKDEIDDNSFSPNDLGYFCIANATALQLCEAFLKTIGKWKDEA